MKKISLLLATLILCGCGGIENNAMKRLEEKLKFKALDPKSVSISDEKVMFKNDSCCVIDFVVRQTNENGGYDRHEMEYYYIEAHDGVYEDLIYPPDKPFDERMKEGVKGVDEMARVFSEGKVGMKVSVEEYIIMQCKHYKVK